MRNANLKITVLGLVAVAALALLVGHPSVSPESFALLGMLPLALGQTVDTGELKNILEQQGKAWEEFKIANDARLKAIESKGFAPADLVDKVNVINKDLTDLGQNIAQLQLAAARPGGADSGLTAEAAQQRKLFNQFLRSGDKSVIQNAMKSTSDPDGGVLILPEMEREIDRVVGTISVMPRIARVVNIGARSWKKRVKTSGMTMAWPGEGAGAGETTEPKFAQIEIVVSPGEVEPWVDNETLEDADIDLAADLQNEAAISFAEGEGVAFITGNGVGKPRGITAYTAVANANYAWGSIGSIASGKSAAFASVAPSDKLIDLQHALKPQYRPGAVWVMNDTVLGTARQMKDGSGSYYLWQPDPTAGPGGRFLGSAVEVDDNMPAIAANSLSVAYGNFQRGYAVVRRNGIGLIRDNVTAKGVTKFNFRRRIGGGVYNFEAIKLMKFATS